MKTLHTAEIILFGYWLSMMAFMVTVLIAAEFYQVVIAFKLLVGFVFLLPLAAYDPD